VRSTGLIGRGRNLSVALGVFLGMRDDESFAAFVWARQAPLVRFAYLLSGDSQTAQDLVQTALARTLPKWHSLDPNTAEAYVQRAIVNGHRSLWRRRSSGERATDVLPETVGRDALAAVDDADQLRRGLMQLPRRQRAVIALRFYLDLTEAQAAERLGCSVGTVKSQTSRGLARLRELLGESTTPALDTGRST
jgi:RNA polymerase sigma-70 factor (sigma-E family)